MDAIWGIVCNYKWSACNNVGSCAGLQAFWTRAAGVEYELADDRVWVAGNAAICMGQLSLRRVSALAPLFGGGTSARIRDAATRGNIDCGHLLRGAARCTLLFWMNAEGVEDEENAHVKARLSAAPVLPANGGLGTEYGGAKTDIRGVVKMGLGREMASGMTRLVRSGNGAAAELAGEKTED